MTRWWIRLHLLSVSTYSRWPSAGSGLSSSDNYSVLRLDVISTDVTSRCVILSKPRVKLLSEMAFTLMLNTGPAFIMKPSESPHLSVCLLRVIRAKASGMKTLARQNEAWEPLCVVSNTAVGVKPHLVPPPNQWRFYMMLRMWHFEKAQEPELVLFSVTAEHFHKVPISRKAASNKAFIFFCLFLLFSTKMHKTQSVHHSKFCSLYISGQCNTLGGKLCCLPSSSYTRSQMLMIG